MLLKVPHHTVDAVLIVLQLLLQAAHGLAQRDPSEPRPLLKVLRDQRVQPLLPTQTTPHGVSDSAMSWVVGVRAHQALRLVLDLGLDQLRIRKRLSIPAANNNDSEGNILEARWWGLRTRPRGSPRPPPACATPGAHRSARASCAQRRNDDVRDMS